ncbi:MAG: DNA recombination protein RmuC [Pseudohongiellaceae bacterium]
MTTMTALVAGLVGLVAAALTFLFVQRRINRQSKANTILEVRLQAREEERVQQLAETQQLLSEISELRETNTRLREQLSRTQTELQQERHQQEIRQQEINRIREQMTLEFKNLANEILEDKSRRFTVSNQENITQILKPLQEKIHLFEKKVEETYDRESKERFSLAREIENLQKLNQRISEDAVNLTNALKGDNKAQGTWGEMILESILEKSGLAKGSEYEIQVSKKAEDGSRGQPDVIVHLPESKDVIIDSKVSLKAYEAWCSEEDPLQRDELLKLHVQSIRNHIKNLASKDYHNLIGVNTLDFVLLFMPIDAAFSIAAKADTELLQYAHDHRIYIVERSTLVLTLRIIESVWRLERQNRNALEIAKQAGTMYDKFVAFIADLEEINVRIDALRKSYDNAHNKLRSGKGNLIGKVEKLKLLGARAAKQLPDEVLHSAEEELDQDNLLSDEQDQEQAEEQSI